MNDFDVIVVGGGNAAFCAALAARECGSRVLVLERAPLEVSGGNSVTPQARFALRMTMSGTSENFARNSPRNSWISPISEVIQPTSFLMTCIV